MWTPYESIRKHPQDFNVLYRMYTTEEGGRRNLPYQGYRCDFSYDGDDVKECGIYAIHPEFQDEQGNILLDTDKSVPLMGKASMWVLFARMREQVHIYRIKVGTKGYFMEGPRRVGEVTVTEIVGLYTNPRDDH